MTWYSAHFFQMLIASLLGAIAYGLYALIRLVDAFYRAWLKVNQQ